MIVCPKCGKELADGTKFCSKCGTPLADVKPAEEPKKEEAPKAEAPKKEEAPKAEAPKKEEAPKAEAPKKEEAPKAEAPKKEEAPKAEAPKKEEAKAEDGEKKGLDPKILKFAGIGVAAVVFLIILIALFSGKKGPKPYALYVKDKELMYTTNLSKAKKAVQISTKLIKESGVSNSDLDGIGDELDAQLSENGKYLFYRDKIESSDDGSTIYYKDLTKLKKESQKMDSSVRSYEINKNSTVVTYLKTGGDLWQFNIKKGEKAEKKVAKNVRSYFVNEDATRIIYTQKNEDDNSTEIHVWTKKSDEKLESDVQSLYYVKDDFKTIYYKKNDCLYKKVGTKDKEKIDSDVASVYRIYENGSAYYLKNDEGTGILYYYNGKESKKIEEDIKDGNVDYFTCSETPIMVYGVADGSKTKYSIAIKDVVKEMEQDDVKRVVFDEKGKTAYFLAELNDEGSKGTLFKMTISGTKVGKIEQYDDDVNNTNISLTADNHITYFKDVKNRKGELFCDKKQIDSDVYTRNMRYNKDSKEIVYFVDFNDNKDEGTLKISKTSGKARQISDEVYDYVVLPNGNVVYLKEYSQKSGEGSLYVFKGKKSVLLDDEVSAIVYVY